ncbi:MAG: hypothetical protein HOY79_20625 [Streptomyces sp.]|nr:hypothetical protein [Streptomyces sp.]
MADVSAGILLFIFGALIFGQWLTWQLLPPRRKAIPSKQDLAVTKPTPHSVASGWGTRAEYKQAQAWWRERCARVAAAAVDDEVPAEELCLNDLRPDSGCIDSADALAA